MFQEVHVEHGVVLSHFTFRVRQAVQALRLTMRSDGGLDEGFRERMLRMRERKSR